MKRNHQITRRVFITTLITLILLSTLLLSTLSDKKSTPAVASYYNFIIPKVRLTDKYNQHYRYRFHPNPNRYMTTKMVTYQHHKAYRTKPAPLRRQLAFKKNVLARLLTKKKAADRNGFHSGKFNQTRIDNSLVNQIQVQRQSIKSLQTKLRRSPDVVTWRTVKGRHKVLVRMIEYKEHRIRNHKIIYLHSNYPIWCQPYRPGVGFASSTNQLAKHNQAMNVIGVARAKSHVFYEITSGGYYYGWIPKQAVKIAHSYQIPFHYYSQLKPIKAPDACEAVSLRMALSSKGYNPRISMRKFIDRIPRSKDPNKGYTANPYHYGDGASIYPKALAKYGRRYDPHVYEMKEVSEKHLIQEIEDGNPVVYEGSYRMKNIDSEHVLVLVGYSNGDLEFADPWYQTKTNKPISWVSLKQFSHLFHQRGARAVVVK